MPESASRGGGSAPGGSAPGGTAPGGRGGGSAPGGCLLRGGGIPPCTEADPPVNRMTDRCKILPWPQLRCGR